MLDIKGAGNIYSSCSSGGGRKTRRNKRRKSSRMRRSRRPRRSRSVGRYRRPRRLRRPRRTRRQRGGMLSLNPGLVNENSNIPTSHTLNNVPNSASLTSNMNSGYYGNLANPLSMLGVNNCKA